MNGMKTGGLNALMAFTSFYTSIMVKITLTLADKTAIVSNLPENEKLAQLWAISLTEFKTRLVGWNIAKIEHYREG